MKIGSHVTLKIKDYEKHFNFSIHTKPGIRLLSVHRNEILLVNLVKPI